MPALNSSNNPITADGIYTIEVKPGQRYALGATAATWSGSLAVGWAGDDGTVVPFPDSPLTANGGFELVAPGRTVSLTMTGTSATTYIHFAPIP
jgi:hypothetical protein